MRRELKQTRFGERYPGHGRIKATVTVVPLWKRVANARWKFFPRGKQIASQYVGRVETRARDPRAPYKRATSTFKCWLSDRKGGGCSTGDLSRANANYYPLSAGRCVHIGARLIAATLVIDVDVSVGNVGRVGDMTFVRGSAPTNHRSQCQYADNSTSGRSNFD